MRPQSESIRAQLRRIEDLDRVLEVIPTATNPASEGCIDAHDEIGIDRHGQITGFLGDLEELLAHLCGLAHLASECVEGSKAPQDREHLRRRSRLLGVLQGLEKGRLSFGRVAPDQHSCSGEAGLQRDLLARSLGRVGLVGEGVEEALC